MEGAQGPKKTLKNKALLYNPVHSDGKIASVRYHHDGRSSVEIIEPVSGNTLMCIDAPDSLQLVETAWMDGQIFVSAISENGYGIYKT